VAIAFWLAIDECLANAYNHGSSHNSNIYYIPTYAYVAIKSTPTTFTTPNPYPQLLPPFTFQNTQLLPRPNQY